MTHDDGDELLTVGDVNREAALERLSERCQLLLSRRQATNNALLRKIELPLTEESAQGFLQFGGIDGQELLP